jgi:hypothetical protein
MASSNALCVRGGGAIDLVGQNQVCEHRTGRNSNSPDFRIEDRHADHVRRQQVARKLHAMERSADRRASARGQRRLAHARHVLDEQVAAREQRDDGVADRDRLAAQHARDVALERCDKLCGAG